MARRCTKEYDAARRLANLDEMREKGRINKRAEIKDL